MASIEMLEGLVKVDRYLKEIINIQSNPTTLPKKKKKTAVIKVRQETTHLISTTDVFNTDC